MHLINLYLNPNGRIGSKTFWVAWVALFVGTFVLNYLVTQLGLLSISLLLVLMYAPVAISILSIYPYICLYTKRLHDSGHSGWLSVIPFALIAASILLVFMNTNLLLIVQSWGENGLTMAFGSLWLLIMGVFVLWVGFSQSDPEPNKFGPPTKAALPEK